MASHSVYGLALRSTCPIPGLLVKDDLRPPDVDIVLGELPCRSSPNESCIRLFPAGEQDKDQRPSLVLSKLLGGEFWFVYEDGIQFLVDELGSHIWTAWPGTLTLEDAATYLLGPILGFILRLRGVLCLHASGVVVDNHGVALLGTAGAGKSTLAAAFAMSGYSVISDDIVPLTPYGGELWMQPGYPKLRLWPHSVQALFGSPDILPRITPTWDKRHFDLNCSPFGFRHLPIRLAAIYVLDERTSDPDAPLTRPMKPGDAFMALVANTYGNYFLDSRLRAQEFSELQQVVQQVPIRRVSAHDDVALLDQLRMEIIRDFTTEVIGRTS